MKSDWFDALKADDVVMYGNGLDGFRPVLVERRTPKRVVALGRSFAPSGVQIGDPRFRIRPVLPGEVDLWHETSRLAALIRKVPRIGLRSQVDGIESAAGSVESIRLANEHLEAALRALGIEP